MDLRPIIEDIAFRADEFLDGVKDRAQARAGISEMITMDHAHLAPSQRTRVTEAVMAVLENEDFFGTEYVGDAFRDDEDEEE